MKMRSTSTVLTFASALMAAGSIASGSTIIDVDFDSTTNGGFGFSGGATSVSYSATATGATGNGGGFTVDTTAADSFAGGGFNNTIFDLSLAGFTAGAITVADLDLATVSFDASTLGDTGINNLRLTPGGGGFGERITLDDSGLLNNPGDDSFTNYSFALSALDITQKTTFVNTLNANNSTVGQLEFSFNARDLGNGNEFQAGDSIVFDNIMVDVAPEPVSAALLGMGGICLLRHRGSQK